MEEIYKITLSNKAKNDIKDIINYIAFYLQEPSTAKKISDLIFKKINMLKYFPKSFQIIDEANLKKIKLRKLNCKNYLIFYRVNDISKTVSIERVLFNSSNWINIFQ